MAGHRLGLLHDLLEHEVAVAALVDEHVFRYDHTQLLVYVLPFQVSVLNTFPGNYRHFTRVQKADGFSQELVA